MGNERFQENVAGQRPPPTTPLLSKCTIGTLSFYPVCSGSRVFRRRRKRVRVVADARMSATGSAT